MQAENTQPILQLAKFVGWGFYPNKKCSKIIKPSVTRNQTM